MASDSTLYRTMRSIGPDVLEGLVGAVAGVRSRVWDRLVNGGGEVVLDIDSSLHRVHSENKEGAAPTYKRGFGFHPMYCTLDATGEALAVLLRPGNAAANNVADHAEVLDAAIDVLPPRVGVGHRSGDDRALVNQHVGVRTDSAGGPSFAHECRRRNVGFSVGTRRAPHIESAIGQVPVDDPRWIPALARERNTAAGNQQPQGDAEREEPDVRAHVIDLTELVDTSGRPEGTRLVVRREPKHVGGRRTLSSFRQGLFFQEIGFRMHDVMIYRKKNTPFMRSNAYTNAFEFMFVLSKGSPKTFNPLKEPTVRSGYEMPPHNKGPDAVNNKVLKELKKEKTRTNIWPEFGGCFAFCLVRGGMGMTCFHYIGGVEAGSGAR